MEYKLKLFGHTVLWKRAKCLGEKDEARVFSRERVNWEARVGKKDLKA